MAPAIPKREGKWWAHKDSNLGPADQEIDWREGHDEFGGFCADAWDEMSRRERARGLNDQSQSSEQASDAKIAVLRMRIQA